MFLTESITELRPFEKEGLKDYFDNKVRDKSLFGGRPHRIEEEPVHVREWFEILDKEVSQFKEDNFNSNLAEEYKIVTYEDWRNIKTQLRKRVM